MYKVVNNPDINEFDLHEALGVFFNRKILEHLVYKKVEMINEERNLKMF